MSPVPVTILLHVAAGTVWLIVSLVVAGRRRSGAILLALQTAAAATTLLAGIALWGLLHAGRMGPAEHRLVLGTFAAFLALGLQLGMAGPAARGARLAGGTLGLAWAGVACLALAAAAMIGSRLVS